MRHTCVPTCAQRATSPRARRQKPGMSQHGLDGLWGTDRETPSFLYAMPLGGERVFLEETCLVARPALPFATLKRRLERRWRYARLLRPIMAAVACSRRLELAPMLRQLAPMLRQLAERMSVTAGVLRALSRPFSRQRSRHCSVAGASRRRRRWMLSNCCPTAWISLPGCRIHR